MSLTAPYIVASRSLMKDLVLLLGLWLLVNRISGLSLLSLNDLRSLKGTSSS
ncbi:MAG: hypothetical protein L7H09_03035 [Acidilobus sp.]|nr:hypothetical protein [Acidilobus sp.]MCG2874245.1 hypothetical protein [Acidilobus sp.]MCG2896275.1 hypothetical protein [Acidilobus sp.]